MWRTYVALGLLVLTIIGGFVAQSYTANQAQEIAEMIPLTLEEATQKDVLQQAYDKFVARTPLLSSFYVRSALDEVSETFVECFTFVGLQNDEEYQVQAYRLHYLLHHLSTLDAPNIENIF